MSVVYGNVNSSPEVGVCTLAVVVKVEVLLEPFVLTVVAVKLPLALCRYSLTIVELATTDLTVPAAEAPPRLPP